MCFVMMRDVEAMFVFLVFVGSVASPACILSLCLILVSFFNVAEVLMPTLTPSSSSLLLFASIESAKFSFSSLSLKCHTL